jgi:spore coat-associated protein S
MIKDLNSEPLNEVLSKYPYTVKSIRTESYKQKKGVWWVDTAQGMKILKKHPNSESMMLFLLAAIAHLQERGIHIPAVNKTSDGASYVKMGETCFILIDAVQGVNPNYKKLKELETLVKEMARFHAASTGFVPPEESKIRQHLGTWLEDYSAEAAKLKDFYDQERSKTEHGEFGKIILEAFPSFVKRMESTLEGLSSPAYTAWVSKIAAHGGLCHQDFAAGNILMNPDGRVYILDTDSLTIELPARDIRKLLNKVMKKNGKWDAALVHDVLRWYQQVNPLTADEWAVVKMDVNVPHLFNGIMDKYYRRREKEWTEAKYVSRLKEMIAVERSKESVLDEFETMIKEFR